MTLRLLKKLPIQILLRLGLVRKNLLQIVTEGESFWRQNHTSLRLVIVGCANFDHGPRHRLIILIFCDVVGVRYRISLTELFELTVQLNADNWRVKSDDNQQVDLNDDLHFANRPFVWVRSSTAARAPTSTPSVVIEFVGGHQTDYRVQNHGNHVEGKTEEKEKEKLVIPKAETIVDKGAMMVESLHTLVAIVAVEGVFGAQIFTIYAHVVKVELLVDQAFH